MTVHNSTSAVCFQIPYRSESMKKQKIKSKGTQVLADLCPDLTYEQVDAFDDALHDYLDICMEIYWQKVAEGSFPWPSDGTDVDMPDSTL